MTTIVIIKDANALNFGQEIDFKYDPNLDNPDLDDYCTVIEEENDRMCGEISAVRPPVVHFNTPYADEPLYINFDTQELRASGDDSLLGTDVMVLFEEDDIEALDADQYSQLPTVID